LFDYGGFPPRSYNHGTFVPLMVAFPEADIPTVQHFQHRVGQTSLVVGEQHG
jgi:aromatic ring-opening dioxygenase catalytic subunit (LigB family)